MKPLMIIAIAIAAASGCLPTREQFPFGEGPQNNVTDDMGDNNVTDDAGNNVTDDAGNNVTDDAGNNVTPDMGGGDDTGGGGGDTGGGGTDMGGGMDMCMPEDDSTFCSRQGAACGMFTSADNCGTMRTVSCGMCPGGEICSNNVCEGCMPEDDNTFCSRNAAECGVVMALDNCRDMRTVNCGGCQGNGIGCNTDNVCVEAVCNDGTDNDNANGADCDDPACLGRQCSNSPNKVCQANGTCN